MAYRYFYSRPSRRQQSNAESVQAKEETAATGGGMKMGRPGDAYEVEADRVADQVMAMEEEPQAKMQPGISPLVQRAAMEEEPQAKPEVMRMAEEEPQAKPEIMAMEEEEPQAKPEIMAMEEEEPQAKPEIMAMEEEEPQAKPEIMAMEEEEPQAKPEIMAMEEEMPQAKSFLQKMEEEEPQAKSVQAKPARMSPSATVQGQIKSSRGLGKPMAPTTQRFMESRIGADFSKVNIHTDGRAVQMSKDLKAQAFTVGHDVYFNSGKYSPDTKEGKHLLAHELTHVVQQKGGKKKS